MNVLDVLKKDHETVNKLFAEIQQTGDGDKEKRRQLFDTLRTELIKHSHAEEKVFYPPLRDKQQSHDIVEEGIHEHHDIEDHLARINAMPLDAGNWMSEIQAVMKEVEHHVREEENEIFPKARQLLGEQALDDMSGKIESVKKQEGQAH